MKRRVGEGVYFFFTDLIMHEIFNINLIYFLIKFKSYICIYVVFTFMIFYKLDFGTVPTVLSFLVFHFITTPNTHVVVIIVTSPTTYTSFYVINIFCLY